MEVAAAGGVLHVSGEIDLTTAGHLASAIEGQAYDGAVICLDMRNVGFIDSTGVHVLLQSLDKLGDGCLILHEPSRTTVRVLEILGLTEHPRMHLVGSVHKTER
jgi:anti-anti-sigma factor